MSNGLTPEELAEVQQWGDTQKAVGPLDPTPTPPSWYAQTNQGLDALRQKETGGLSWLMRAGGLIPPNPLADTAANILNPAPGSLPQAAGGLAATAIPGGGLLGSISRVLSGGTAAGVTAALGGEAPSQALGVGLEQAGGQAGGETLFGAGRGFLQRMRGKRLMKGEQTAIARSQEAQQQYQEALAAFEQSEITRENKFRTDKAAFQESERARAAEHTTTQASAKAAYNAQRAAELAAVVKSEVPAWEGQGNTANDLWNMAFGPEWKLVQDRYDAALKQVIAEGRGQSVIIPKAAADALGLDTGPVGPAPGAPTSDLSMIGVDGGALAGAMTGKWWSTKTRWAYRIAARAIDEAGIGNPASRAEYRNASAFQAFADKSQAFKGKVFDPQKALIALGTNRAGRDVLLGSRQAVNLWRGLNTASRPFTPSPEPPSVSFPPFLKGQPPEGPPPIPTPTITRGPLGAANVPATLAGVAGGIGGFAAMNQMGHFPYAGYFAGHTIGQGLASRVPVYRGVPPLGPPGLLERGARTAVGEDIQQAWDYIMSNSPSP